jgi:adenylate kinase
MSPKFLVIIIFLAIVLFERHREIKEDLRDFKSFRKSSSSNESSSGLDEILILLGPPGAGKGTLSSVVSAEFGISVISTSNLLRNASSSSASRSKQIHNLMKQGKLISDDIVIGLLLERISQPDCKTGFILDGFPRTVNQAEAFHEILVSLGRELPYVVYLNVTKEVLESRIKGRLVHQSSGRTYHRVSRPPKNEGLDDVTGEPLMSREDDDLDVFRIRLAKFYEESLGILLYYKNIEHGIFLEIDGDQTMDEIMLEIFKRN